VLHNLLLLTQPANTGSTLRQIAAISATQAGLIPLAPRCVKTGLARLETLRERADSSKPLCDRWPLCLRSVIAALLVLRRVRSARRQGPPTARPTGQSATQEEARVLLRKWAEEKTLLLPPTSWRIGRPARTMYHRSPRQLPHTPRASPRIRGSGMSWWSAQTRRDRQGVARKRHGCPRLDAWPPVG